MCDLKSKQIKKQKENHKYREKNQWLPEKGGGWGGWAK